MLDTHRTTHAAFRFPPFGTGSKLLGGKLLSTYVTRTGLLPSSAVFEYNSNFLTRDNILSMKRHSTLSKHISTGIKLSQKKIGLQSANAAVEHIDGEFL